MDVETSNSNCSRHSRAALGPVLVLALLLSCATQAGVADYNQGVSLLAAGKATEAISALERARQADPAWGDARLALGKAYAAAGKHREAWVEFREALRLAPRNVEAQQQLQGYWQQFRKQGVLVKGASLEEVRAKLGEPDSILDHYGGHRRALWVYGRYGIEFRREKVYELREQLTQ